MSKSLYTPAEISEQEQRSGLLFAGYLQTGLTLVPVLVKPGYTREGRQALIMKLNGRGSAARGSNQQ